MRRDSVDGFVHSDLNSSDEVLCASCRAWVRESWERMGARWSCRYHSLCFTAVVVVVMVVAIASDFMKPTSGAMGWVRHSFRLGGRKPVCAPACPGPLGGPGGRGPLLEFCVDLPSPLPVPRPCASVFALLVLGVVRRGIPARPSLFPRIAVERGGSEGRGRNCRFPISSANTRAQRLGLMECCS